MTDTSLTYTVGADTSKYDNAMSRLRTTTQQSTAQMLFAFQNATGGVTRSLTTVESQIAQVNSAMTRGESSANSYGESIKGLRSAADVFIFVAAAVEGTTNIVNRLKEAINDAQGRLERLLKLAQQSQETGAGTGFIAALTAQFRELGIQASTAQSILAHAREASVVRQGEGPEGTVNASTIQNRLRQQIENNNLKPGDDAAYNAADTQEERYKAILDIMEKLEAANKRLAAQDLGKTFFGDDFEKLANQGLSVAEAFRKAAEAAKGQDAGNVDEQVHRAKELKAEAENIGKIYDGTVKQALSDIAYLQDLAAQKSLEWQRYVAEVASNFATIYEWVRNIVIKSVEFGQSLGLIGDNFGKFTKAGDAPAKSGTDGAVTTAPEPLPEGATPMVVRVGARKRPPAVRPADTTNPIITKNKGSKSTDTEEPDAVEQYIRQLNKARDVAQAEFEAVGKTVTEREWLLALARAEAAARDDFERGRRDSPKLDDDERARTIAAANKLGDLKARTLDLEQTQRQAADTARYFGQTLADGMADAALEGRSLNDVLNNIMKSIARASLSAILTGQGPLAGVFGTAPAASAGPNAVGGLTGILSGAFKGAGSDPLQGPTMSGATLDTVAGGNNLFSLIGGFFRANGGPVEAGKPYTVGESGREMFIPSQNGRIVPIDSGHGLSRAALLSIIGNQFRANGGPVQAGTPYTVGEMGREMFIPNQNGRIVPIDNGPGGWGGGGTTNVGGDTINITPAGGVTYEQMAAFFTARDQRLQRDLPMLTARSQSRYGQPRR